MPDGKVEVTGTWADGRTGIFRQENGQDRKGYGGMAVGEKGESPVGSYDGYDALLIEIIKMFRTKTVPVTADETLELYAFMEAADESKRRGGAEVSLHVDTFGQWDVHVYHFVEPLALQKPKPSRATVGSRVTLPGRGLAAVTAVSFGGAGARFAIRSDRKLVARVPRRARTGQVEVVSPLGRTRSRSAFAVLPSPATRPRVLGVARVGHSLKATTGTWYGDPALGFEFQWLACNTSGRDCNRVPGANRRALRLGPAQIGKRFRVRVSERTRTGSARALSAPTAIVGRKLS